ncbi:MAG: tripartite tricarboxylate transporter substrate binding protein [Alphaproteobacteria bacterium]|nr:tripartite tricarboxylate transporter substrate binding protein [Alphaproteobacteria bacterium]
MVRKIGAIVPGLLSVLASVLSPGAASAQAWQPTKPVTMVIPFPPGPGLDLVARLAGDKLSAAIGQPVVYENRTGASGSIAAEYVARAAPDGYTLMAAATSTHATNVHLIKNLSYDPVKNFTPIVTSVETIGCLVVNTAVVPVKSVAELVAYAKANPGNLSFGSSGAGSFFHLAGELFNQVAGVKLTHVPYRGSVAAFTDLIGGHIQVNFTQLSQAMAYRSNENLKVLAVLETVRFSAHPEFPSISEQLPGFRMPPTWNGLVGPSGMPEPVVVRLNAELNRALFLPEVKSKLEDNGYRVVGGTGEAFGKRIEGDIAFYGPIFKSVGVAAQ